MTEANFWPSHSCYCYFYDYNQRLCLSFLIFISWPLKIPILFTSTIDNQNFHHQGWANVFSKESDGEYFRLVGHVGLYHFLSSLLSLPSFFFLNNILSLQSGPKTPSWLTSALEHFLYFLILGQTHPRFPPPCFYSHLYLKQKLVIFKSSPHGVISPTICHAYK